MALTLTVEQRLGKVSMIQFFDRHHAQFHQAAQRAKDFLAASFPHHSPIRPDDLAKALLPIIEVDEILRTKLSAEKLAQKYWVGDFVDLIVDRTWSSLT